MALEVRPMESRLMIQFDQGVNAQGNKVIRSKTLSKVKNTATAQDVYDVALVIANLQTYPVVTVRKVGQDELVNV